MIKRFKTEKLSEKTTAKTPHLHIAKDGNNDTLREHTVLPTNEQYDYSVNVAKLKQEKKRDTYFTGLGAIRRTLDAPIAPPVCET